MNVSIEKLVNDILDGLEMDFRIIMGITPEHRKTLEVLMIHSIKAWEKVKSMEEILK